MSDEDRVRWDRRHGQGDPPSDDDIALPEVFRPMAGLFPHSGAALDLACGPGTLSVWLARRGLSVHGVDVSGVAVAAARDLAIRHAVADRCRFDVVDLDDGLPPGDPVDVLCCIRFRDPALYPQMVERLAPGGMLAISVLSEVGGTPGAFRARAHELTEAFGTLEVLAADEGGGQAWLLARRG
ncbi:class I SAM-dependent methyltransferase [Mycobacterium sp. ACS4331]|uniref:class I SAM-dependent methyltransferase n=1 Tax=Mycobacterium sp. ACS4331 TaxID=1834121 RepID=UPI0007FE5429|nr:class I SAM-dependent methyltransferase [Mycobacterium sp. ACS4331]OBF11409.1 SAM-dependent methyltransferase [Mycobacterium sp. ACS4331]